MKLTIILLALTLWATSSTMSYAGTTSPEPCACCCKEKCAQTECTKEGACCKTQNTKDTKVCSAHEACCTGNCGNQEKQCCKDKEKPKSKKKSCCSTAK